MPTISSEDVRIQKSKRLLLNDFSLFTQALMPPEWFDSDFHVRLCRFMQHSGPKKMIILPRTHLKTTICATFYPLWRCVNDPGKRVLETSNTTTNAKKTVHAIKSVIQENSVFNLLFPEVVPNFTKTRWSDECACLKRPVDHPEGTFEAAGVGANIIRRHFNIIIEDDTVAPKKDDLSGEEFMPSREDVEQAVGFHRLVPPLLINEDDEILVICTRWCDYDHISYIMEHEKYDIFDEPAIREVEREGKKVTVSLYKRFSLERLDNIRQSMGTYMFSALYLNNPRSVMNMDFKPKWIKYYEENELPAEGDVTITVDPADPPTGKKRQDYSAIVSCKHSKRGVHVRRYVRSRLTDGQVIKQSLDMAEQDEAIKIRIEIDRYAHLVFGFKEEMARRGKYFIIDAVKTRGHNKEARIRQRLQPLFENGVIYFKRGMNELENELFSFPKGVYDDLIDALAWQIEGIYPTEKPVVHKQVDVNKIYFTDMLRTLYVKKSRYPFEKQLGGGGRLPSILQNN